MYGSVLLNFLVYLTLYLYKSHVFGATITKVMESNNQITVWGNGEEGRDLLYIDDLLEFVLLTIKKQDSYYEILNCGINKVISIKSLVNK